MTRPFFLLTFFYLLAFFAHSQEVDRIDKYREDQFYIGFSLAIQDKGIPEFKQNGFSNYFQSLSNLQIDDLWLDNIFLSDSFVKIKGSALNASLIPSYFASFSEESVFRGQRFQLFELDRKADTDWKVDFTIATEEVFSKK